MNISRETLVHMGALQPETDAAMLLFLYEPKAALKSIGAAVQTVGRFVRGEGLGGASDNDGGVFDAVGIAAHSGAEISVAGGIICRAVKA